MRRIGCERKAYISSRVFEFQATMSADPSASWQNTNTAVIYNTIYNMILRTTLIVK